MLRPSDGEKIRANFKDSGRKGERSYPLFLHHLITKDSCLNCFLVVN